MGRNRTNCKRTVPLNEKMTSESFIKCTGNTTVAFCVASNCFQSISIDAEVSITDISPCRCSNTKKYSEGSEDADSHASSSTFVPKKTSFSAFTRSEHENTPPFRRIGQPTNREEPKESEQRPRRSIRCTVFKQRNTESTS